LVILMMVTVADVFLRYLFNSPVRGSYDMVESMLLVFVFNAMAAGFFLRRNIVIDLIDSAVGARATALLIRIADVLSVVCFLGLSSRRSRPRPPPADLHPVDRRADRPDRNDVLCARRPDGKAGDGGQRTPRMSPSLIGLTGVFVLFALLILRVPIWIALMLVGFFGNVSVLGWQGAFALAGTAPFDVASSYTLSVVPLFILMGEVAS